MLRIIKVEVCETGQTLSIRIDGGDPSITKVQFLECSCTCVRAIKVPYTNTCFSISRSSLYMHQFKSQIATFVGIPPEHQVSE